MPNTETARLLPNLVIIGAMKCGTTALHRYLDHHPEIAMAQEKELNFFIGDGGASGGDDATRPWHAGNWHRGVRWYADRFTPAHVRGETSPGYTSPSAVRAPARMADLIPEARLIYLVRDPVERAISQYRHHLAEGSERRAIEEALFDPSSQYLARSRYHERLSPFLARFPREQILVCAQEELLQHRRATLAVIYRFLGVESAFWCEEQDRLWHIGRAQLAVDRRVRARLGAELREDANRFRDEVGRDFPGWAV